MSAAQRPHVADYHPEGTPDLPEEHSATHHVSLQTYLVIFALLMVLLVVTVLAAFYVDLGAANILVALLIALVKAALVVLFFMHVKYEANWKYVLTIPATFMAIFLGLALVPDIGMRTRLYSEERWNYAAEPVEKTNTPEEHH